MLEKNLTYQEFKNIKKNKKIIYEDNKIENLFKKQKIDLILHCATNYGTNDTDINNIIQSNLVLPLKLLSLAKKYKIKRFINTDTVLNKKISLYTLSKFQFYEWFNEYSKDLYCCNVKIEHFFGPKDNETKFVISLIKSILKKKKIRLTKGEQKRDFIYIKDVVSAFEKIIINSLKIKKGKRTFEIGTGKSYSIKNIVLLILKLTNRDKKIVSFGALPYRKNELMNIKLNIKRLKKIGWKPNFNLQQGLIETINYYKKK